MKDHQRNTLLAFAFGTTFVITILAMVVAFPNPTAAQYEIFRIIIALAAGGVGAVVPGLLNIQMDFGISTTQRMALRAGGALAVFVVVYFYSPAEAIAPAVITQVSGSGSCNSNIANVSGNVTTNCRKTD